MSLNNITIMGRLTRDPELRRTQSGTPVTSFTLAVDRDYSGKDGGQKETDFIDCLAWRSTAEFLCNYFAKGRMAIVSGRLQTRTYKDKEGNNRKATEVVAEKIYFGDSKPAETSGNGNHAGNNAYSSMGPVTDSYASPVSSAYAAYEDEDPDLPF